MPVDNSTCCFNQAKEGYAAIFITSRIRKCMENNPEGTKAIKMQHSSTCKIGVTVELIFHSSKIKRIIGKNRILRLQSNWAKLIIKI